MESTLLLLSMVANPSAMQLNILSLVWAAGPVVKLVILSLILFSVYSLTIIWDKRQLFKVVRLKNQRFLKFFWSSDSLEEIVGVAKQYPEATLSQLYLAAIEEIGHLNGEHKTKDFHFSAQGLDNVYSAINSTKIDQKMRLERLVPFLATTGSATPFIGLFGTVWGIMNAFRGIGASGSANLAIVAPGIAEALIATAFGLFAAIPAVIAYNYFTNQIRSFSVEMDQFLSDLMNIFRREFTKN